MRTGLVSHPNGACAEPKMIAEAAARFGLLTPTINQIVALRGAAASLFPVPIASLESFASVETLSGSSIFGRVQGGRVSGYLALMRLRSEGLKQLQQARFDPLEIDTDLVARPSEAPAALYAWGFAATDSRSAYAVVSALDQIQRCLFWAVPKFCSIASQQGERLAMNRLGFRRRAPGDRFAFIPAFNSAALAHEM